MLDFFLYIHDEQAYRLAKGHQRGSPMIGGLKITDTHDNDICAPKNKYQSDIFQTDIPLAYRAS